jgi:AAA family ATP:ADP antiporter
MTNALSRFLRLRTGEAGIVFTMGFVLLFNSLAQQISEITALSNFLSEVGVNLILVVWIVDSFLILGTMGLQSLIVDRFNRLTLVRWLIVAFAAAFILMRLLHLLGVPEWLNYALLYLLAMQQLVFFPVIFWVLANDIFNVAQATRLFPLITSFGFIGKLLGISISLAIPRLMDSYPILRPEGLLIINASLYVLILGLFSIGTRSVKLRQTSQQIDSVKESLTEGWDFVHKVPAFRFLALSIVAILVCDVVLEFRFLVVTNSTFSNPASYQTFYAAFSLGLTIATILVQSLLTSRVISRLTIKNTFIIKPLSCLAGSAWMFIQTGLIGTIGGIVLLRLSQYAIDMPNRNAFLSLVPEERRGRVSIFNESYLYFVGIILGCLITGGIVLLGSLSGFSNYYRFYLGVSIVTASFATYMIYKLRQNYDTSMLNWRLKRRQRGRSVLDQLDI